jgi:hypothetical protein
MENNSELRVKSYRTLNADLTVIESAVSFKDTEKNREQQRIRYNCYKLQLRKELWDPPPGPLIGTAN